MRPARLIALAAPALAACGLGAAAPPPANAPALALPIACEVGRTCFVQQYMDHDPGPGARDYRCGPMAYQAHTGVDIRLPTDADRLRGVAVLAAAAGTVKAVRDGVPDVSTASTGRAAVQGRECGNGVLIDHGSGWESQVCHMARGSIAVRQGQTVATGTPLGRVGLSGDTEFPHLHFTVRQNGTTVDPFAHGAAPGQCGGGRSLWSPEAARALAYRSPAVLNMGFASGPVTMDAIDAGRAGREPLASDPAAVVVFARAIGLAAGDVQHLALIAPDGRTVAQSTAEPLVRDRAQHMLFVGDRRPSAGWPRGLYRGRYTVRRGGRVAATQEVDIRL